MSVASEYDRAEQVVGRCPPAARRWPREDGRAAVRKRPGPAQRPGGKSSPSVSVAVAGAPAGGVPHDLSGVAARAGVLAPAAARRAAARRVTMIACLVRVHALLGELQLGQRPRAPDYVSWTAQDTADYAGRPARRGAAPVRAGELAEDTCRRMTVLELGAPRTRRSGCRRHLVSTVPTSWPATDSSLRGKARASFLLAVEDIAPDARPQGPAGRRRRVGNLQA